MNRESFLAALLEVMESKEHWAWGSFTNGTVAKERLHLHFEQEYESYVRDFPVLIGWAFVQCPNAEARRELAENLFEEETGGLVAGRPHPELFLEYPRGLGMDLERFKSITLLPQAQAYRDVIDDCTQNRGWSVAAAVTTLFIEGTKYERGEVDSNAPKRPETPLEEHPLVVHYGLPIAGLALTKAHRKVEGAHRQSAWQVILDCVPDSDREAVILGMKDMLLGWKGYRDAVAIACGLTK